MPKKIAFNVIYASGEEEKYKACELDRHGPSIRGWQSAKDCSYPQEVVLRLHSTAILHQIQILAHQYLISERIDLFVGPEEYADDMADEDATKLPFEYLGYITLSDNQSTEFKSRELKSITVPPFSPTSYVKLRLYQNHNNDLNLYNQVSIVAIQLIGDELGKGEENNNGHTEHNLVPGGHGSLSSACDDLAFEMYVDKDVARIIRLLEQRKHQAVQDERFEYARKLKSAMVELRAAGERLGKLEIGKKQAIIHEDYSKAKKKKAQMDEYRKEVYALLEIEDLLEENGPLAKNDEESPDADNGTSTTTLSEELAVPAYSVKPRARVPTSFEATSPPQRPVPDNTVSAVSPGLYQSPVSPLHYAGRVSPTGATPKVQAYVTAPVTIRTGSGSLRRRNKSAARNSYEAYDERTVPAHRNTPSADQPRENNMSSSAVVSKLNERERKQAALPIAVFGMALVEKFFSKQFSDKEEGLRLLQAALRAHVRSECVKPPENTETHSPNKVARAAVYLLHRALRDKVFIVYSTAAEIIRYFFSEFVSARVSTAEVSRSLDRLLPELLSKSGDTTPRIHNMAIHTILSLADCTDIRSLNIIPVHLTRVLTSSTHPRLALSKMEMVEQLILNRGISTDKQSGMTCRVLSELGVSGLHHPAEAVRKVAERILIHVYKVNSRIVRKQLPPDDDITRRNLLYRHLMQEFDKVDLERKPTDPFSNKNKLVRSGSVTSANTATSSVLRPSTSAYTHSDNAANIATNSSESHSASSSSSGGILSPPPDQPLDKQCIFCLERSESFTEEGLNIHYWKSCPMLMRCQHCQEVVEVASLNQHLADECDLRKLYKKCDHCSDVQHVDSFEEHRNSPSCLQGRILRCPLCRTVVGAGEDWWREHLNGIHLCSKHPRRKFVKTKLTRSKTPDLPQTSSSMYNFR
uniref:UVR domain-containing protein n=1 Tax=Graphocephala atropunctata TaxID=36148 RepID=A0A1B6L5S4_9HEMI